MQPVKDSYGLHPQVERIVLWYCVTKQAFWGRIGKDLDPELFGGAEAKPILQACRSIQKETGTGPSAPLIVIQWLQNLVTDGKFTQQGVTDVYDLFEEVEDARPPEIEAVMHVLVPVVRDRMQKAAIEAAHHDYAKKGDFSVPMGLLDKAHRLGATDELAGVRLDATSGFGAIARSQSIAKLPTGVVELDLRIRGLDRKGLGVWLGDSGAGKSIALEHGCAESARSQIFSGFITLELSQTRQLGRLYANLTGIPTNDIIDLEPARLTAQRRMAAIEHRIGRCEVAEFAPHATQVKDLVEWIDQKEQAAGAKMEALFVDYADKMHHPGLRNSNEYEVMRYVYEGLRRDIAVARDMWVWTASQATRPNRESKKRLDLSHVADSMHKIRVADLVVTMTRDDEDEMLSLFVAKNRNGPSRFEVGPLMTEYECGRLVPLASELADWGAVA